jgi:hunchback-like protein
VQQPTKEELPFQQQQQQSPLNKEELLLSQHQQPQSVSSPEKDDETHVCHHCDIIFKENIMYSMHMGFHSFRDPFACNLCGEITADKFSFFAHIARVPHS